MKNLMGCVPVFLTSAGPIAAYEYDIPSPTRHLRNWVHRPWPPPRLDIGAILFSIQITPRTLHWYTSDRSATNGDAHTHGSSVAFG